MVSTKDIDSLDLKVLAEQKKLNFGLEIAIGDVVLDKKLGKLVVAYLIKERKGNRYFSLDLITGRIFPKSCAIDWFHRTARADDFAKHFNSEKFLKVHGAGDKMLQKLIDSFTMFGFPIILQNDV